MTKKERILNTLNHKDSDIVPFHADFTLQADEIMKAYTGNNNYIDTLDLHLNAIQYWGRPTEIQGRKGYFIDDFGIIWNRSGADKDIGVVENQLITDFSNIDYVFPSIDEEIFHKEYKKLLEDGNDKFTIGGIGFSMFERAWSLSSMTDVLMAMLIEPVGLHKLLDMICDYNCMVLNIILEYDLDGVYFGDDWGQQHGLIMGPAHWREFIKPYMQRMYKKVKDKGLFVIQHSCGDVETIFDDLIEIGLDCYQTFQPEIYDIVKVKAEYGDQLAFWGGISTQQLLSHATPNKVKEETIRTMKIMGASGGYIAAPTHAIEFDVPPENILAMFEVFQNQDKYL